MSEADYKYIEELEREIATAQELLAGNTQILKQSNDYVENKINTVRRRISKLSYLTMSRDDFFDECDSIILDIQDIRG